MKQSRMKLFKVILVWLITLIIFVLLFQKIDMQNVIKNLKVVDLKMLLFVSVISLIAHTIISGEKYRRILEFFGCHLPLKEAILIIIGSMPLKGMMPLKSGELVRAAYLHRRHGLSYGRGISSILIKSLLSLFALAIFILSGWTMYEYSRLYVVLVSLLLIVLLLRTRPGRQMLSDWMGWVHHHPGKSVSASNPENLWLNCLMLLVYSLLFEGSKLVNFYILFRAFSIEVPYREAILLMPLTLMAASLPITVFGLGTRETSTVILFSRYASSENLLGVGLCGSFVDFLLPVLLGLFFVKPLLGGLVGNEVRNGAT